MLTWVALLATASANIMVLRLYACPAAKVLTSTMCWEPASSAPVECVAFITISGTMLLTLAVFVALIGILADPFVFTKLSELALRNRFGLGFTIVLCCVVFGSGLRELKMAEPERHLSGTK